MRHSIQFLSKLGLFFILSTALFLFMCCRAADVYTDPLTPEERAWLSEHDNKIVLGHDPDAKPIDYLDENGVFKGLAADYTKLLEEKLQFKFDIVHVSPWAEVVNQAKKGEIDVLCTFTRTPEREEWMLFTDPYIEIQIVILTRNDFKGSLKLNDMDGMRVSFTKGWITDDYLSTYYRDLELVPTENSNEAMNLLATGVVDAWVTALTVASNLIEKNAVSNIRIAGETDLAFMLCFASRKDWPLLNSILQKGLNMISEAESAELRKRWIHITVDKQISKEILFVIIGAFILIILIIIFILGWNRSLRKQVEIRTAELKNELEERITTQLELKKTRDLLFSVIDNSRNLTYVKDLNGRYILINNRVEHLFGIDKEKALGKNDEELFDGRVAAFFTENDSRVFKGNEPIQYEGTVTIEEGDRYYLTTKFPLYDSEGNTYGICGISTDITEQRRNAEKIEVSLKEKDVLLREIHHRVKNNMQVTISLLELQSLHVKEDYIKDVFKDIENKIASMALVHEKLYQTNALTNINFRDYVQDLTQQLLLSYGVEEKKIRMNLEVEEIFFEVDFATPCGLIISELVSNSLKHAFQEVQDCVIEISLVFRNGEYELVVSDNGCGLPEGVDYNSDRAFGLGLVFMLVENQLEGSIERDGSSGTKYTIRFRQPVFSDGGSRL